MRRSWAQVFRNEALPLIDEERFAEMYSADMGRPNRAVQTVLGVLVLKEMFDLTDIEALEELEFNLLWHHALGLEMEEAHLAQKTLHNFRVRLMEHDGGRLAFCETTDRMIEALGLRTGKQRVDSTHIMSNIAVLTRLGLFCETIRVFLLAVSREHPGLGVGVRCVPRDMGRWQSTRMRMRLSGWRYTSPGRCVSPARCVPGALSGGAVALSLGESGHGVERTC